jgi:hypothetical protein
MRSRFVGALAVAVTSLGMFAGTAGASNHGWSGGSSTTSIYDSTVGGTCNAAYNDYPRSDGAPSAYWGYPGYYCEG